MNANGVQELKIATTVAAGPNEIVALRREVKGLDMIRKAQRIEIAELRARVSMLQEESNERIGAYVSLLKDYLRIPRIIRRIVQFMQRQRATA